MGIYGSARPSKAPHEGFQGSRETALDVIAKSSSHKILYALIREARLVSAVRAADKITLFAPTDAAFRRHGSVPKGAMKALVLGHVLQYSKAPPPNHERMQTFKTLANTRIDAQTVRPYMRNGIAARNGVVFVTDVVLT